MVFVRNIKNIGFAFCVIFLFGLKAENDSHAIVPIVNYLLTSSSTQDNSIVKKTGQTVSYADYDDGYYQKGDTPSYTRDNLTEIVTDHVTGLQWQDDVEVETVKKNWEEAKTYCKNKGNSWRLPTRRELRSIAEYSTYDPAINSVFEYAASGGYWSSTTYAGNINNAWDVFFRYGYQNNFNKEYRKQVRCVRAEE